jgi:hypothetical protein
MRMLHAEGPLAKRAGGDLPESSLRSSNFRRRLQYASIRNRVHNRHGAAKKMGSRKRGYAPVEMEHKRTEGEHQADGSITFYETRGVRDSSTTFLFSDFDETFSLGNHTGHVDADTFASLFKAANSWLGDAKEKDFFKTSDDAVAAKQSVRTKRQRKRVDRYTFQRWWFEIGMKHGFLSPAAIAANFLTASEFVHRLVSGNQQLERAIYQFADAWHWMHFEEKGEHELAWKSVKGRAQGPAVKQERAELKKKLVKERYEAFASEKGNGAASRSAKWAAVEMFKQVNQKLEELGLSGFAVKTLADELRPLIKARFPKPKKVKATQA